MDRLQYIECFGARLSSIELSGCDSLLRLCMENNDLGFIDLNPVSGTLRDLRMSGNRSTLIIAPLSSPLRQLYHYCVQSIAVTGHPSTAQLPSIDELFNWNSGQSGALVVRSNAAKYILTYGNEWTSLDLAGQFPPGRGGYVDAHGCRLYSVDLSGDVGLIYLDLRDNALDTRAIDGILSEAASWGTGSGMLLLSGNAAPSGSGIQDVERLTARGWTVDVDTAPVWNNPYNDVDGDAWYAGAIRFVNEAGLMRGDPSGAFTPYGFVTRAMLVTILHRLSGENGSATSFFSDVSPTSWYGPAVGWASSAGITSGVGGTRFAPNDSVSREETAVMLYRYAGHKGYDLSAGSETNVWLYNDASSIDATAFSAFQWACGAGIMNGDSSGRLRPFDSVTRAELAAMLQRFASAYALNL
jgi:hypothetical protein